MQKTVLAVYYGTPEDSVILKLVRRMANSMDASVTLLKFTASGVQINAESSLTYVQNVLIEDANHKKSINLAKCKEGVPEIEIIREEVIKNYDLIIAPIASHNSHLISQLCKEVPAPLFLVKQYLDPEVIESLEELRSQQLKPKYL